MSAAEVIPERESEVALTGQRETAVMIRNASKGKELKKLAELTIKMGKAAKRQIRWRVAAGMPKRGMVGNCNACADISRRWQ